MRNELSQICIFLVALLTMLSSAAAQAPAQNDPAWEAVKALPYGEPLTVKLKGGTTLDGTMISASETNLKMYKAEQSPTSGIIYEDIVDLKKEDILNVYRIEKKSGKKWVIIGAVVGAAAGAATGAAMGGLGSNCQSRPGPFGDVFSDVCGGAKTGFIALGAVGGATTGAYVGHLIGRKRLKRVLIYKSK
jgi:hypothetical protein